MEQNNTFRNWKNIYLSNIKNQGKSENTIAAYDRILTLFGNWKGNDDVNTSSQELLAFFTELNVKKNLKPASLHQYEACISSFYKFLVLQEIIEKNPMDRIDRPKVKNQQLKSLHHGEVMELVDNLQKEIKNPVYSLIVRTIYATGLRISELCNLKIENIDFKDETITIIGKGNKVRTVCCEPQTLQMIKEHVAPRTSGYVFEGRSKEGNMSRQSIERIFKENAPSGITPHKIRHSFATELYKASHDLTAVQTSLGHSSIQTTQIYLHNNMDEVKKAYSSFPLQIQA